MTALTSEPEPEVVMIFKTELGRLRAVEREARRLIREGLRNNGEHLIVVEKNDKSDPHYALCEALEALEPLNPKPALAPSQTARPESNRPWFNRWLPPDKT